MSLHEGEKFGSGFGQGLVPRLEAFEARQMEATRHLEARQLEPRLPLPGPQELEAIKRVAQLLVTIGEQVIPAIIGDNPAHRPTSAPAPPHVVTDVPSDPVQFN
ncbi:unnamed protein product [Pieris brassicae]|uniref:Uncharacterized protein n=1 Tax=Pieris brassicae TaxID=7116 RepID=A0A9P0TLG6_PIEBR|nr:unnamed protein product [Pieris brassicae]